jgi:HTH-type transcriptional regulator / antitoxin HigA
MTLLLRYTTMPVKTAPDVAGNSYMDLIRAFPLRMLRNEADLDAAIEIIDRLTDRDVLDPGEQDYLDVLARLVEDYEDEHDPLPAMTGVEALRFLIAENGLSQAQLSKETGIPETSLCEVLTEKRGISPKVRTALAERFKVDPTLFV